MFKVGDRVIFVDSQNIKEYFNLKLEKATVVNNPGGFLFVKWDNPKIKINGLYSFRFEKINESNNQNEIIHGGPELFDNNNYIRKK